jgi:uncharacterized DUF497 family protein
MALPIAGFDWDQGNRHKCQKHGVSLAEIESAFLGTFRAFPDPAHSAREARYIGVGATVAGRHVLVAYTHRVKGGLLLIRPISARFMHAREVNHYESQIKDP